MSSALRQLGGAISTSVLVALIVYPAVGQESERPVWEKSILPNLSDYGGVGALQTPTARFGKDGQFFIGGSYVSPYHRYFANLQILDWLEGTFRYTRITDQPYSTTSGFADGQDYKDRSVDVKLRLGEETEDWPAVAVGFRDIGGTNLFGAEYFVASKKFGNFDVTGGLGFGSLGTRDHFGNPLGLISDRFKYRGGRRSSPGSVGTSFFTGPMALFGSVAYRWEDVPFLDTDIQFHLEYDPNNYKDDYAKTDLTPSIPFNFGMTFQPVDWIQVSAGFERGDTVMARVALAADFNNGSNPLRNDGIPPEIAIRARDRADNRIIQPTPAPTAAAWLPELAEASVGSAAASRQFVLQEFDVDEQKGVADLRLKGGIPGREMEHSVEVAEVASRAVPSTITTISIEVTDGRETRLSWSLPRERLLHMDVLQNAAQYNTAASTASADMPADQEIARRLFDVADKNEIAIDRVEFTPVSVKLFLGDMPFRNYVISAGRAARVATQVLPPQIDEIAVVLGDDGLAVAELRVLRSHLERLGQEQADTDDIWYHTQIQQAVAPSEDAILNAQRYPAFDWSIAPRVRQQLGGPDGFYLFQLYMRALASVRPTPNTEIDGFVGANIYNNFDQLKLESDSKLPHVRSDVKDYLKEGQVWIGRLQGAYYANIFEGLYGTTYAGLLEEMYGGVGGEILYKEIGSPWALGLDVNWVKQRDYDGMFNFRNYETVTGHVGFYYDLPFWDLSGSVRAGRYLAKDWGATFELAREFESGIRTGVFATFTDVSAEEFGEGSFDKGFFISIPLDIYATRPTKTRFGLTYRPLTRDGGQQLNRSSALIGRVGDYTEKGIEKRWPGFMD